MGTIVNTDDVVLTSDTIAKTAVTDGWRIDEDAFEAFRLPGAKGETGRRLLWGEGTVVTPEQLAAAFEDEGVEPAEPGGAAAGVPLARPAGVTIDSETYDDPSAPGTPLTVAVVDTFDTVFAIAVAGDAFPRMVFAPNSIGIGDGTAWPNAALGRWEATDALLFSPASGDPHDPALMFGGDAEWINEGGPVILDTVTGARFRVVVTNGVLGVEAVV